MEEKQTVGLLKDLEDRYNGKITDRTFALSCYLPSKKPLEHGIFLFKIGDTYYYEDFEKEEMNLLGFTIKRKSSEPFEKTSGSFKESDIKRVFKVSRAYARSYHFKAQTGNIKAIREASRFVKMFRECTYAVELQDGNVLFFEMINNILA